MGSGPCEQDTQFLRDDEESRLLAEYEACHAEQLAAAEQLSNPRHSMLYPTYARLVKALAAIRLKCSEKWFAVRAYRRKMQHEGKFRNPCSRVSFFFVTASGK